MNEKASSDRQVEKQPGAPGAIPAALPRLTNQKSRVTNCKSRITTHQSPLTNHAFLIDIWRLEIAVTRWKHTMGTRSNRHGSDTPPIALFASTNVVSAPRRVLASPFSALGVPSLWRNPRVHREHPPGGGIEMLIPMHSTSFAVLAVPTRNACSAGAKTGKRKLENRRMAATFSPIFTFRFSNFDSADSRGET